MGAIGKEGRGGLFDELLIAALNGAVARRDDVEVAERVAGALGFDVACDLNEALDEVGAKVGAVTVASEEQVEVGSGTNDGDAASAAPVGPLEDHGIARLLDECLDLRAGGDGLGDAGYGGDTAGLGDQASLDFVAERVNDGGRGAEPRDAGVFDGPRELGVFGEETVAGMDGVGTGFNRDGENLLAVKVRRGGIVPAQSESLVRFAGVGRRHVLIGVDGDGGNAHVGGGAADAQGDLPSVRDEDSVNCSHASP